jgi:hypothetical protein
MNECLSDLRIDMWLAGDLEAREQEQAGAHADGCPACAARVARIRAAHAALVPDLDAFRRAVAARRVAKRRYAWHLLWPALGAAAAVAAFVFMLRADSDQVRDARRKGSAHVGLYVKHGETVRRGGPDEQVSPGDLVRFTVSLPTPTHLAIVGVDKTGAATIYFPPEGATDEVPAGEDIQLPRATLLDEALGPEILHVYFCPRALGRPELEQLRAALQKYPGALLGPNGCTADRLTLYKVPAQ